MPKIKIGITLLNDFESLFGGQYLQRGKEYYQEGLVKSLFKDRQLIRAVVEGNSPYRVKIDLKSGKMSCSCPCDFNCKHLAATFYALRANKADDVKSFFAPLHLKTKKELEVILQKIVLENPELVIYVDPSDSLIKKQIENLLAGYDDYSFEIKVERLMSLIEKKESPIDLWLELFKRLYLFYDQEGGDTPVEKLAINVLYAIEEELAKPSNKSQKKAVKKSLLQQVSPDYDYLLEIIREIK